MLKFYGPEILDIATRYSQVQQRIVKACLDAGRKPDSIELLAVGKRHPAAAIDALYQLGQRLFGESYVRETVDKQRELTAHDIEWHLVGPLQSNKTRLAAAHFHWVHSVDRAKLITRLAEQRPGHLPALNVLVQVNIDDEAQKAGIAPNAVFELAELIVQQPRLSLRGLMAIPNPSRSAARRLQSLREMRALFDRLARRYSAVNKPSIDTLSLGMSADLEAAVAAGTTMVRIGTDLFGPRS